MLMPESDQNSQACGKTVVVEMRRKIVRDEGYQMQK